jgi:hypothetical protein
MNTHLLMYADAQDRARRGRVWIHALGARFGGDRRGPVPTEIALPTPATLHTTVAWI